MLNDDFIIENGVLKKYIGTGGDVVIPEGVTSIGERAFDGCDSITHVTIPNMVTSIGDGAFSYCVNLKSVTMADSVLSIGLNAFSWCQNLVSITLSKNITYIGDGAFCGCVNLLSVEIPNGIATICPNSFLYCHKLNNITIPQGVSYIGDKAFSKCLSLTTIEIPNGTEFIGDRVFEENINLSSITFPNSVKHMGNNVLYGCIKLESVSLPEGVTLSYKLFGNSSFPQGLIEMVTSSPSLITDGALKNYILTESLWECLTPETKAEIIMNRQSDSLRSAYSACVKKEEKGIIAELILKNLPIKSSIKFRNNIIFCIKILSCEETKKHIEKMYEWVLEQRKRK